MAKGKTKRHASALKAKRKSLVQQTQNYQVRSRVRTLTKQALEALSKKNVDEARQAIRTAQAAWQKAAQKGIFSRNSASRKISSLTSRLAVLAKG